MIREAESHADEAHRLRELADAKNHGRDARVPDREEPQGAPREARRSPTPRRSRAGSWSCARRSRRDDLADIRAKTEALQTASHKLAEVLYAQATAQQAADGAQGGNGAARTEDEVVEEADYEVIDEEEAKTS